MSQRNESEQQEINAEQGKDTQLTEYVLYVQMHTDIQIDGHMPMNIFLQTLETVIR